MRRVLALRDFRLLWSSQALSSMADMLVTVALALYVNRIGTPTDVGLVLACGATSFIALLLIGGAWADRLPRTRVMIATDLWRGGLHAFVAVLILTGTAEVWMLCVTEALFGAGRAFFRPAYTGLIPQTVPDELMTEAQAVTQLAATVSNIAGPALGALLVVTLGAGEAFAIDAATFFASAAVLTRVQARDRGGPVTERRKLLREIGDGFAEVRKRPWIAAIIFSAMFNLLTSAGPQQALGPDVAHQVFGSAALYGVMSAVFGAGLFGGATLALRWKPGRPALFGLYACLPWSLEGLVFALGPPFAVMLVMSVVSGFGIALFEVWWEACLVLTVPPAAYSRVSSIDWMGSLGLLPVGLALAGPVGSVFGERETLAGGAILSLLMLLAVTRVRSVQEFRYPKSGTPAVGVEASP